MPICADPNCTVPVVLESDQKLPDPKPTFFARHLSVRKVREAEKLMIEARDSQDEETSFAKLSECMKITLAGWENVGFEGKPVVFGADDPIDFLTIFEIWELARALINAPQLAEKDLKNSASQPVSAQAPSAEAAAQEPA